MEDPRNAGFDVTMKIRAALIVIVAALAGMAIFLSVIVSYLLPTIAMNYGSEESAVAKYRFTFVAIDGNRVVGLLRTFASDHNLEITVVHVIPLGQNVIDVSIEGEAFGLLTITNRPKENQYRAYYYKQDESANTSNLLEDLRTRFARLGATIEVEYDNSSDVVPRSTP